MTRLSDLVSAIEARAPLSTDEDARSVYTAVRERSPERPVIYHNRRERLEIDFEVERLDFARKEALDPRMVRIAPGCRNEYHKHAHESLFVVLSGQGRVLVDGRAHSVAMGDVLFVPRWVFHQTINTSPEAELVLLAVTDFGLTSSVLGDYDRKTRLRAGGDDVRGEAADEASGSSGPAAARQEQP